MLFGTPWEPDGNALGTEKKQKNPFPPPKKTQKKNNWTLLSACQT
jgi:hypothetical protein